MAARAEISVLRSQTVILVTTLVSMAASLAATVIVGRALSPAAFGFFALVASIFGLARDATDLGSGSAAARRIASGEASERQTMHDLLRWRLFPCLLVALVCLTLVPSAQGMGQRLVIAAAALAILLSCWNGYLAIFQTRQRQELPALIVISMHVATLCIIGLMLLTGAPAIAYALLLVGREVGTILLYRLFARRLMQRTPFAPPPALAGAVPALHGVTLFALATLSYQLSLGAGILLVQWLRPAEEVGAYSAALRLAAPLQSIPWMLTAPMAPFFARLAASDPRAFARQASGAIAIALALGLILAASALPVVTPVLRLAFGASFATGALDASGALAALVLSAAFTAGGATAVILLFAQGLDRQVVLLGGLGLIANLAVSFALIPRFGFLAPAIGCAAAAALACLFGIAMLAVQGLALEVRPLLVALAPGAALALLLLWLPVAGLSAIMLAGVLALGAIAILWLLPATTRYRIEQRTLTQREFGHG